MVAARKPPMPAPPPRQVGPIIHTSSIVKDWLTHYWQKLNLPASELSHLAVTQDRREYVRWTGKRLQVMVLGCYCYLPASVARTTNTTHTARIAHAQPSPRMTHTSSPFQVPPIFEETLHYHVPSHRHLVFIEPDMQLQSLEVTVAHELIHLADRVNGTPRRHHHHGYDSIAADEAAITDYGLEDLRRLLHEESLRREGLRRERRPIRYVYECPNCGKQYPRTRRYSQSVSCSTCDKNYNPHYRLALRP